MKNNKKRNVGFLYEALVRELTKAVLAKDTDRQNKVKKCLLEFFNKGTNIGKQRSLFKSLMDTSPQNELEAQRLVQLCVEENDKQINQQKLFEEQNRLISFINREIGHELYENYVPNYKILSTINAMFNRNFKPEEKLLFERVLRNDIMTFKKEEKKEPIRNSVLSSFIKIYNKEYGSNLLPESKQLLNLFITNDESLEYKFFLNEEIDRIKTFLKESLNSDEDVKANSEIKDKLNEVYGKVESISKEKKLNKEHITLILKTQKLIKEMETK